LLRGDDRRLVPTEPVQNQSAVAEGEGQVRVEQDRLIDCGEAGLVLISEGCEDSTGEFAGFYSKSSKHATRAFASANLVALSW